MENSISEVAANYPVNALDPAAPGEAEAGLAVDEGGYALLDAFWPMPIGLLVMGTVVAVFFGICTLLR